jgi:hypothetical protein
VKGSLIITDPPNLLDMPRLRRGIDALDNWCNDLVAHCLLLHENLLIDVRLVLECPSDKLGPFRVVFRLG